MNCIIQNCTNIAEYGFNNEFTKKYCKTCSININNIIKINPNGYCCNDKCKKFVETGKLKKATYNYENISRPIFCVECKLDNMVVVHSHKKKCITCNENDAFFNFPNQKGSLYCKSCAPEGTRNTMYKYCDCNNKAKFISNNKKIYICEECYEKNDNQSNFIKITKNQIKHKCKCNNNPLYTKNKKYYCNNCIKDDISKYTLLKENIFCNAMINNKRCDKYATFLNNNDNKKYCLECINKISTNYTDTKHNKCIFINPDTNTKCNKRACFNYYGLKAEYCKSCSLNFVGMINVESKKCEHIFKDGTKCLVEASFNYPDKKTSQYCVKHCFDGMIEIKTHKCIGILENKNICGKQACFGEDENNIPTHCIDCAKRELKKYYLLKYKKCIKIINGERCKNKALYNIDKNLQPIYCEDCSFNIKDKYNCTYDYCISDMCYTVARNNKYNGYCSRCFHFLYPDSPLVKNYKTKEYAVCEFIKENFQNIDLTFDKIIENGCSKRRPDILIDMGSHCIIVEVDENQHHTYDITCENKRLMEISQDLQHRPIVFIRFNPDNYINKDNKRIKSCWSVMKNGLVQITKKNEDEWKRRLNILKEKINFYIENTIDKTIEIIQLFYDEIDI